MTIVLWSLSRLEWSGYQLHISLNRQLTELFFLPFNRLTDIAMHQWSLFPLALAPSTYTLAITQSPLKTQLERSQVSMPKRST